MSPAQRSSPDYQESLPPTLAWAGVWARSAAEVANAGLMAWSSLAQLALETQRGWISLASQAADAGRSERLALTAGASQLLADELAAAESATEHLAFSAEETLVRAVGRLPPLPE